jgi:endonuclease G
MIKTVFLYLLLSVVIHADNLDILIDYLNNAKIDKVLEKDTYTIYYSNKYKQPIYTISDISPDNVYIKRPRDRYCIFKEDLDLNQTNRSVLNDYRRSGYDRGHIASYASLDYTIQGAQDSCLLSNMSPQLPKFNRATWRRIEHQTREIGKVQTIKVITVVFFDNNPWNNKFVEVGNHLQIPDGFAKIIMDENNSIIQYWFLEHK